MRILTALPLCLCLATPLAAQDTPAPSGSELSQGVDLMGEATRLLLRGLMAELEPGLKELGGQLQALEPVLRDLAAKIGDIRNYQAPEQLPNGDIILRRKVPLLPPALRPPAAGEVEL